MDEVVGDSVVTVVVSVWKLDSEDGLWEDSVGLKVFPVEVAGLELLVVEDEAVAGLRVDDDSVTVDFTVVGVSVVDGVLID